jgi:hypothetical protein
MPAAGNERFFKIDLAAASDEAGYTLGVDRSHDGIAVPPVAEHLGVEKCIILVICVMNAVWDCGNSQARYTRESFG